MTGGPWAGRLGILFIMIIVVKARVKRLGQYLREMRLTDARRARETEHCKWFVLAFCCDATPEQTGESSRRSCANNINCNMGAVSKQSFISDGRPPIPALLGGSISPMTHFVA